MTRSHVTLNTSDQTISTALAGAALSALKSVDLRNPSLADRQVRQPDTWLLRRCYQALALYGDANTAFAAAELVRERETLSPFRVLPPLARRAVADVGLAVSLSQQIQTLRHEISRPLGRNLAEWSERLLALACAAAHLSDSGLALAALERMDQAAGAWTMLFSHSERRELLADTVAHVGLHPLTVMLMRQSLRQEGEVGAQFLQQVAVHAATQIKESKNVAQSRRLLRRCVEIFQYATLTSLLSRRYAAAVFGLTGDVGAILEQVTIIANIQEARRESGVAYREGEGKVLRQVKRPRANLDADFQLYTLKEAVDQVEVGEIVPAQRRLLAERLARLGTSSDGWTAAATAGTLLHLGEIDHAIAVVDQIDRRDPMRSEAFRVLVEGLLAANRPDEAWRQTQKGIAWAQSLAEHHPERLTIWGTAEAYLTHGQASPVLEILNRRRSPGLWAWLRRLFGELPGEETLREDALRMYAALIGGEGSVAQALPILATLRRQAPQSLDGKALALFYTDHVLVPLLVTGHYDLAWSFLQDIRTVLGRILSREQPARVEAVALLLVEQFEALSAAAPPDEVNVDLEKAHTAAFDLLTHLWERSAAQGIWPTVYTIGGSLPLVIALAGPQAVLEIARFAAKEGHVWRRTAAAESTEETENEEILAR